MHIQCHFFVCHYSIFLDFFTSHHLYTPHNQNSVCICSNLIKNFLFNTKVQQYSQQIAALHSEQHNSFTSQYHRNNDSSHHQEQYASSQVFTTYTTQHETAWIKTNTLPLPQSKVDSLKAPRETRRERSTDWHLSYTLHHTLHPLWR